MKHPKVSNTNARAYVQNLKPFIGSNTFAVWTGSEETGRYVVYSYGTHWPMFIWDAKVKQWFVNDSRFGKTTSKQHTQLHPHPDTVLIELHVDDMCKVATSGITALINNQGV